jgi:hypothetical protein
MIQNINPKGTNFKNTIEYVLKENKEPEIILTNLEGKSPKEMSEELKSFSSLNTRLKKIVFHSSLSLPPGEKLSNEEWEECAKKYLKELGFDKSGFVVVKHNDEDHDHVHIVASRTNVDGKTVSDSWDYKKGEKICREIEMDYSLQRVSSSSEREMNGPTRGEFHKILRTNEVSVKLKLQDIIKNCSHDSPDYNTFSERLDALSVKIIPNFSEKTGRVSGISYELEEEIMKGSDLGKAFSFNGIQKKLGVRYEQNEHIATIKRQKYEYNIRGSNRKDKEGVRDKENRSKRTRRDDEASRGSNVGPNAYEQKSDKLTARCNIEQQGRVETNIGKKYSRSERFQDAESRNMDNDKKYRGNKGADPKRSITRGVANENHDRGENREDGISDRGNTPNSNRSFDGRVGDYSIEGICNLVLNKEESKLDLTINAISEQVDSMGCKNFDLGIRSKEGKFRTIEVNIQKLKNEDFVRYLRFENYKESDIYIKPHKNNQGLVLIDDVSRKKIEQMKRDGYNPSVTVETSKGNHQTWTRFNKTELREEEYKKISKGLAKKYEGDMASTDCKHYGRLAGFTNNKPEHRENDGKKPWVKVKDYGRTIDISEGRENAKEVAVQKVRDDCKEEKKREHIKEKYEKINETLKNQKAESVEREFCRHLADNINKQKKENGSIDYSKADFYACMKTETYGYKERLSRCIEKFSPNIESRKELNIGKYADRTASKAIEIKNQREMARGFEMER